MKSLRFAGLGMLAVVLLVILVSFFLPTKTHVERSAEIHAPAPVVFAQLADFENWNSWEPWSKSDSTLEIEYPTGNTQGVGSKRVWHSQNPDVGDGSLEITHVVPNDSICIMLHQGESHDQLFFKLREVNGITKVVWGIDAGTEDPPVIGRYFGLMLEDLLGPRYEQGLADLKRICESGGNAPASTATPSALEVVPLDMSDPIWAVSALDSCHSDSISAALAKNYGKLLAYVEQHSLNMVGAPLCRYHSMPQAAGKVVFECGLPIADSLAVTDPTLRMMRVGPGPTLQTMHVGPYSTLGQTHEKLQQWMAENGYEAAGSSWESYITDPGLEPDASKWETAIFQPVAKQ